MRSVRSTSAWAASSSLMMGSLLKPTATPKGVMPRSSCTGSLEHTMLLLLQLSVLSLSESGRQLAAAPRPLLGCLSHSMTMAVLPSHGNSWLALAVIR